MLPEVSANQLRFSTHFLLCPLPHPQCQVPSLVSALHADGSLPSDEPAAMAAGTALMGFVLSPHPAARRSATRAMHEAGILRSSFRWLRRLAPWERPAGADRSVWRTVVCGASTVWDNPSCAEEFAPLLQEAGFSLDGPLGVLPLATNASPPESSDPHSAALAILVVALFSQSPGHRATVLRSSAYAERLASLIAEAVEASVDIDPSMALPTSSAMLALAFLLRACTPAEAAAVHGSLSGALAASGRPGGLVPVLLASAGRSDWNTPHRGWAFTAMAYLAAADWASAGVAAPGPLVTALKSADARATFLAFAKLGFWSARAFLPGPLAAALRHADEAAQSLMVEELLSAMRGPSVYAVCTTVLCVELD